MGLQMVTLCGSFSGDTHPDHCSRSHGPVLGPGARETSKDETHQGVAPDARV